MIGNRRRFRVSKVKISANVFAEVPCLALFRFILIQTFQSRVHMFSDSPNSPLMRKYVFRSQSTIDSRALIFRSSMSTQVLKLRLLMDEPERVE